MPTSQCCTEAAVEALKSGDLQGLGSLLSNSLLRAAATLNPEILTAYAALESFSPLGVTMTGSGSCVFALFESPEFCAYFKSRYRGKCECLQVKTV